MHCVFLHFKKGAPTLSQSSSGCHHIFFNLSCSLAQVLAFIGSWQAQNPLPTTLQDEPCLQQLKAVQAGHSQPFFPQPVGRSGVTEG